MIVDRQLQGSPMNTKQIFGRLPVQVYNAVAKGKAQKIEVGLRRQRII
jgi:hypothetical protein